MQIKIVKPITRSKYYYFHAFIRHIPTPVQFMILKNDYILHPKGWLWSWVNARYISNIASNMSANLRGQTIFQARDIDDLYVPFGEFEYC